MDLPGPPADVNKMCRPFTPREKLSMRLILSALLSALVVVPGLSADDKKDETIDAAKLVGKWEPSAKAGLKFKVVIEYTKDGKFTLVNDASGKEEKREGTYKVDGNKVIVTMSQEGKENPITRTITKLTDTEFVTTDEKGLERTFVRIKDK